MINEGRKRLEWGRENYRIVGENEIIFRKVI